MFTIIRRWCLFIAMAGLLGGCQSSADPKRLKVGTVAGPETALMEVAKQVAAKQFDLNIEIIAFADYVMPNVALHEGSIDANVYQHQPYLDTAKRLHGYQFETLGKTFVYPMAAYSKQLKTLASLPDAAIIAIPNDPSNEGRALLLLNQAGLIKLKPAHQRNGTLLDIAYNPKKLVFKELDAAQLPRALSDVHLAVINTNYAFSAGLLPKRDGLIVEGSDSPYANIIVVRSAQVNDPRFAQLLKALQSNAVLEKAQQLFKHQAVPAW